MSDDQAQDRQSVIDEWFPVAATADITPGCSIAFELLDDRYLLLADTDGAVTVMSDTCPHRGAQLSLGSFDGVEVQCPYHGWRFDTAGVCLKQPAHPDRTPPAAAAVATYQAKEAFDLWWVCLGDNPRALPHYPAFDQYPNQSTLCAAKQVNTSGPRVVENFLDLGHLPFVHEGSLGVEAHADVADHEIAIGDSELRAIDCDYWQPQPGPSGAEGGRWVSYSFGVSHPYAARLVKLPKPDDGDTSASFDILLAASPESEERCRVWMLTTAHAADADLDAFNEFGAFIFNQDVAVIESQRPALLPLNPRAEVHQRADRMSMAYRRWLAERGTRYGTTS